MLDADIRGYFDAISHEWLVKFIEHRIAYRRVLRHIKKWLSAGVLEDGSITHIVIMEFLEKAVSLRPLNTI